MALKLRNENPKPAHAKPTIKSKAMTKPAKTHLSEKRKAAENVSPAKTKKQMLSTVAAADENHDKAAKKVAKKNKSKKAVGEQEPQKTEPKLLEKEASESEQDDADEADEKTLALVDAFGSSDEASDNKDATGGVSSSSKSDALTNMPKPPPSYKTQKKATTTRAKPFSNPAEGENRGVMYVGRLPHGFYETELERYFSQWGDVTRLRVARNKKTGASRHFAFVEFADAEVAEMAAKTMDSYLLFGHILRCRVVPLTQVHPELFKGGNRKFRAVPWTKLQGKHLERAVGESIWQRRIENELRRRQIRAENLKEMMDYEYEAPKLKVAKAKNVVLDAPASVSLENGEATKPEEPIKAIEAAPTYEEPVFRKAKRHSTGVDAKKKKLSKAVGKITAA